MSQCTHRSFMPYFKEIIYYKYWKCKGNQNSSLRIETSNHRPLRNGSFWVVSIFFSYTCAEYKNCTSCIAMGSSRNDIQDGGILVWGHFAKIKLDFFETKRIIVINTSCSVFAVWFMPAKNSLINALVPCGALALFWIFGGRKSYNKCHHIWHLFLD